MKIIREIDESGTSHDYERLFELAQKQSVICVVDHKWPDGDKTRGIARTVFESSENGSSTLYVQCSGTCYIWAKSKEQFLEDAQSFNLAFVDPMNYMHDVIKSKVNELLDDAIAHSSTRFKHEAINWGDLEVVRVLFCKGEDNKGFWLVEIEELHSDCPELQKYLLDGMKELGVENIVFRFEW